MKKHLLATVVIIAGFACNASAALLAPFTDIDVKAGEKVYIYYGLAPGLTNQMICKTSTKNHDFSWFNPTINMLSVSTSNKVWVSPHDAPLSGVVIFNAGKTDGKISCEYN